MRKKIREFKADLYRNGKLRNEISVFRGSARSVGEEEEVWQHVVEFLNDYYVGQKKEGLQVHYETNGAGDPIGIIFPEDFEHVIYFYEQKPSGDYVIYFFDKARVKGAQNPSLPETGQWITINDVYGGDESLSIITYTKNHLSSPEEVK